MITFIKNFISHLFFTSRRITRKAELFRQKREKRYVQFFEFINTEEKTTPVSEDSYGTIVGEFLKEISGALGLASSDEIDRLKVTIDLLNKKLEELSRKP